MLSRGILKKELGLAFIRTILKELSICQQVMRLGIILSWYIAFEQMLDQIFLTSLDCT